jgi:hypothetical protein
MLFVIMIIMVLGKACSHCDGSMPGFVSGFQAPVMATVGTVGLGKQLPV